MEGWREGGMEGGGREGGREEGYKYQLCHLLVTQR